ncbi:hypothetical protein JXB11_00965 [Candidatus Woesearchaeota archaeon]|nr:hypothetical protein [Candidatus Woesearchaeota archaeon]
MHTLDFLNAKRVKEISQIAEAQWGAGLPKDYFYLLRKDGDLFIVNRDIEKLNLDKLRLNSLGLYIGELRNYELRLSIEGAQLLGPKAKKNAVEITNEQLSAWLHGEDLDVETESRGFVILKCGKDFVGCGKLIEGKVLNFVPKARRVKSG